jgi:hypothetical protein
MSDILETYVKKIRNNLDNLGNKFAQLELCSHNEIKRIIKEIEEIINNIDNLMKNFSIELIMNQTSSNEINNFRESLSKYKLKLKKIKEEDKKVINNNNYLDENIQFNSFNKLKKATKISLEMQNMTGNILGDLNIQSDKMKNVHFKINEMNDDLSSSTSLLTGMNLRERRNQFTIIVFGIFLFLIFISICFIKYFRRN